jgi:hypothetical protein
VDARATLSPDDGKDSVKMHPSPNGRGCFRLANWDAEYLLKLAWVGMPVEVVR